MPDTLTRKEQLRSALEAALAVIEDYLAYRHSGDPWEKDARIMCEMDINEYAMDGRMEYAKRLLGSGETECITFKSLC